MQRAIITKALADLRGHRSQNLLIFSILAAAAATLTLSLVVRASTDDPWERAFDEANGAHVTFNSWIEDDGDAVADLVRIAELDGVANANGPFPGFTGASVIVDGDKYDLSVSALSSELPEVSQPLITDGRWLESGTPETVIDRALARDLNIAVGDTISIQSPAGMTDVTVAGLAISPWRGPYPDSNARVYVDETTLATIEPDRTRWFWSMSVRATNPDQLGPLVREVFSLFPGATVVAEDWQDVRDHVAFWNEINAVFLGIFSLFALVAAGLIVANIISARVLAQFRDIGLLKAVGFTPGQVTLLFLIEHLAIALAASLAGIAIGTLAAPLFTRRLAESMATTTMPAFDLEASALVLAGVLLSVALFTLLPAWRGGRISTVRAITTGFAPASDTPSRLARLATRLGLGPAISLGVKDAFARPWRATITVISLLLTIVTVTISLGLIESVTHVFDNPALQGEPFDLIIERDRLSDEQAQELLASTSGIDSFHTRTQVMALLSGPAQSTDQEPGVPALLPSFTLRVAGGDVANAGYVVPEGRMFAAPGEAVAASGLFEEVGLRVGDTLDVEINGALTTLTIVGRYLDDDDDGSIAMTGVETVRAVVPTIEPDAYLVNSASDADDLAIESALLQGSGYDFDIWTRVDEAEGDEEAQTLKTVMFGLSGVLLAIGTINLVATTMLGVRERMRDYGIYRAIGLTPGQVILTVASNVGLLALIAAVVGIPLGLLTFRVMFEVVASDLFGAAPEWFRNPPVWQMALILPGAVAIAAIASALPARQAARLQVARVLHWD